MATLYAINQQIEALTYQMVDEETGEINEEVMSQLADLEVDMDEKLESIGVIIKEMTGEVDMLTAEKKGLEKRIKTRMSKIERLCNYVNIVLDGKKKALGKVEYSYRNSERVDVVCEDMVPDDLCVYKTTRTPSKTDIKKLLKDGKEVPGCVLTKSMNLQVK